MSSSVELDGNSNASGKKYADFSKPVQEKWKCCKGYIRCSTPIQLNNANDKKKFSTVRNHYSLEVQEEMIRKEAEKLGLPLNQIFRDEAVSGNREDRNGFDEMISDLKRGDVLIVVWLSRLSRNLCHFYKIADKIHQKGVRLISIRDDIDTSKPGFELVMHFSAYFSNMEREMIRTRISDTLAYKKENGQHVGRIPYGKVVGPDGKLRDIPEKRPVIEKILELRREGRPYRNIMQILDYWAINDEKYKLADDSSWTIRLVRSICIREMGEGEARDSSKRRYIRDEQTESSDNESSETESTDKQQPTVGDITPNDQPINQPQYDLKDKPLYFLRAMLLKQKEVLMLSEEEIISMSKADVLQLLS
jgi:DNA invertase Pin-like site-specific DNA recombinase